MTTPSTIDLCILLPLTSKGSSSPENCIFGVHRLAASIRSSSDLKTGQEEALVGIVIGLDEDDPLQQRHLEL